MNCPVCANVNLVMADRQGVEIDYCPQCRGIWLDRGELDKIIERSSQPMDNFNKSRSRDNYSDKSYSKDKYSKEQPYYKKKKKRDNFLEDLFDFDF